MRPVAISVSSGLIIVLLTYVTWHTGRTPSMQVDAMPVNAVTLSQESASKRTEKFRESRSEESKITAFDVESLLSELQREAITNTTISRIRTLPSALDGSTFDRGLELASTVDSPLLRKEYVLALWARAKSLGIDYIERMLQAFPEFGESHWNSEAAIEFSREDIEVGLDYAETHLHGEEYRRTVGEIFSRRAALDPQDAARALRFLKLGPAKDLAVSYVAIEWSKADLQGSIQWAQELDDIDERVKAFGSISHQWGFVDPQASLAFASSLPVGSEERGIILNNTLAQWSGYAPRAAIEWLQLQDFKGKEDINSTRVILRVWASNEPAEVFAFLSKGGDVNLSSKAFREEITGMFVGWARKDPERAVDASLSIPDPRAAVSAFTTSYSSWVRSSPMDAARWADALPIGETKDRAIRYLIPRIKETGVKLAWAEKIGSDAQRKEISKKIIMPESEEAVVEILNSRELNLSAQFKSEIVNMLVSNQK